MLIKTSDLRKIRKLNQQISVAMEKKEEILSQDLKRRGIAAERVSLLGQMLQELAIDLN